MIFSELFRTFYTFDWFDNDDNLAIDFEVYDGITIDGHKEAISPKENTLAYFGESTPSSNYKTKRKGKNNKHRSLGENQKAPLDPKKEKSKHLPRIQDEKDDAMNISVQHAKKSFWAPSINFHVGSCWCPPPSSSLCPAIYNQILLLNLSNTQDQTSIHQAFENIIINDMP